MKLIIISTLCIGCFMCESTYGMDQGTISSKKSIWKYFYGMKRQRKDTAFWKQVHHLWNQKNPKYISDHTSEGHSLTGSGSLEDIPSEGSAAIKIELPENLDELSDTQGLSNDQKVEPVVLNEAINKREEGLDINPLLMNDTSSEGDSAIKIELPENLDELSDSQDSSNNQEVKPIVLNEEEEAKNEVADLEDTSSINSLPADNAPNQTEQNIPLPIDDTPIQAEQNTLPANAEIDDRKSQLAALRVELQRLNDNLQNLNDEEIRQIRIYNEQNNQKIAAINELLNSTLYKTSIQFIRSNLERNFKQRWAHSDELQRSRRIHIQSIRQAQSEIRDRINEIQNQTNELQNQHD